MIDDKITHMLCDEDGCTEPASRAYHIEGNWYCTNHLNEAEANLLKVGGDGNDESRDR